MDTPLTRRRFLRTGAAGAVLSLAGCRSATDGRGDAGEATSESTPTPVPTPDETGTYAPTPSGPEPYPNRPTEPDREAAVEFARAFERTRAYNKLHAENVEDISVEGAAGHDRAAHGGHYVLATATGYANYADDVHADWGQLPVLYFVSPGLVVRPGDYRDRSFDCSEVFASEDSAENFATPCEGQWASYRVHNFDTATHQLTVSVALTTDGGSSPVLDREYTVEPTGSVQQESVTYRRGTYRVRAETASGATATADWRLDGSPEFQRPLTVLLTPVGDLRIRRVPFGSVR
ncbi:hypothetical protein ACFQL1_18545 [Halomicroarcula sp. GCM10025709]|uniref:hypothetical protein n=1 Tax=Haloarcula TaxID=2237 RepID=UPI0024C41D9A|nr:hypothetical protein [Halomicroarcula sp. YJ-61-S]